MRLFQKNRGPRQQGEDWGKFNHPSLHYEKPKELKRFQAFFALVASALLVFGLWSFVWYSLSAVVKAEVTGWVDDQRAMGAIVDFAEMKTGGFPSRITLTVTEPRYEGPAFGEALNWQADKLTVMARPWRPWHLHVEAPGKHELNFGGDGLKVSGVVESLIADVVLGDVWPEELDLRVQGLSMNGSAPLAADRLSVVMAHNPSAKASETGLDLNIRGQNITVPGGLPQPLGDRVETIDLAARITGSVMPGPSDQRLPAWRESGGMVDVKHLKFRGGPLGLAATGAVALDKGLQPEGAFTAKIEGLFQVLEILRAKGIMRDADAVVATMALSALSKRPKGGGAPTINVSVTVQDGDLSLGPLKVMKMPHFDWGFAPKPKPLEPAAEPTEPSRDYKDVKPVL